MRHPIFISFLIISGICLFASCDKWKDPAPTDDPRLTNLYCNNPVAVNYNVGFPGKPDNSVCFFPSDLFQGTYIVKDSVYVSTSGLFLQADSFEITIVKYSDAKIGVTGFCKSGLQLYLTAGPTYIASMDTLVSDRDTIHAGQMLCRELDTISGTITKDRVDSTLLHINLQIVNDTGITALIGNARKK
ncbi:MAG: hypothetical protein JWQ38_2819 [Flavipsychrobacter sp.]|nr:hypothetical protein [Flavipsychrobacter sp.]